MSLQLKKEKNYDFRKRMLDIYEKDIIDSTVKPLEDDFVISDGTVVFIPENSSDVIKTAVWDLSAYLFESMNTGIIIKKGENFSKTPFISISLAEEKGVDLGEYASYKGYRINVTKDKIEIIAFDDRGIAAAIYFLEDVMTSRKAPFIKSSIYESKPMFSPQMVHSGYGLDDFPDSHLRQIAHAGRDAILVYTKGVDESKRGPLDFNTLVHRALKYGIDVYAYSDMHISVHPDSPGAEAHYESVYGEIFKNCPGIKGVILVGESVGFPSKDENVTGIYHRDTFVDGIPTGKVSPGWYPCCDYPEYVSMIKKVVRKYNENADIVLWTYNWGYQPEEARLKLIENLPTDISLLATFEMIEAYQFDNGAVGYCADYTLSFEGPGHYFKSEAIAAKKRGIRLYSMTNTAGLTWDMGCIPYQPMPYQWIKRCNAVIKAHDEWNLSGIMESHHYGIYPSFISKLTKYMFTEPRIDANEILNNILKSEFGEENLEKLQKGLKLWSDAITYYVPTDGDQYGAFRVGTSYPVCVGFLVNIPRKSYADMYSYPNFIEGNKGRDSYVTLRIDEEIKSMKKMKELFDEGLNVLDSIENKNENLLRLVNMGHFMSCSILTGLNAKIMYTYRCKLKCCKDKDGLLKLFDEIEALVRAERDNAEESINYVTLDSRLGWEPRMEYSTDEEHIRWKLRHSDYVLNEEIPTYRKNVLFEYPYKD